jgi:phage terminase Nu1 subunit (DNA packaging protein)
MENYFNYFTEIEEHFQRRRGTILLLSTLDWALIETWKDAGIPLEAVLRGIDSTFEKYERRPRQAQRRVNGLAYCSQEVLAAAEDMKEAAVGTARPDRNRAALDLGEIAAYLTRNAAQIEQAKLPDAARPLAAETARSLRELASDLSPAQKLEELERRLTVMEEKLFAVLLTGTPDDELVALRTQADREIAPYRNKMPGMQIEHLHKQCVHKMLLERYGVPRLSLFYM